MFIFRLLFVLNMSKTLENTTGEVVIKESTVEAVEAMLKHIYTGDIPSNLDQEKNLDLLQLADMYRLDMLKSACAEKIVTSLSIANCLSSFITISRYFHDNPENKFKKMVNMFMRCKAKQVTYEQEDTWKELAKKYPDENLEIVRAMLKEGDGEEVHGCMFCIV